MIKSNVIQPEDREGLGLCRNLGWRRLVASANREENRREI